MRHKKSLLSILLILITLVITARFLFFISYISSQKTIFRSELIKHSIAEAKTVELKKTDLFKNKNGYVWKEHNKELAINGVYHEVVCVKLSGDKAFVTILEDKEENRLFLSFFAHNKNKNNFLTDFIKILSNLTFLNHPEFNLKAHNSKPRIFLSFDSVTLSDFHPQLIKPPKSFFI